MKSEYADVYLTKIIDGYETQVVNRVKYNESEQRIIIDAVSMEAHNVIEEKDIIEQLVESEYSNFNDGYDIYIEIDSIIPLSKRAITVNNRTLTILIPTNDYADPRYLRNYFI